MYGVQELSGHCAEQLKAIKAVMDKTGTYHPDAASLYTGLKRSVAKEVQDSIRRMTLREFLVKSGSTGVAGAAYLVPVKLHDQLVMCARDYEITPKISSMMISGWSGGDLDIPIVSDESYWGQRVGGGGSAPHTGFTAVKATLSPQLISTNINVDNSLIEDNEFGLLDWCVRNAAQAVAWKENRITIQTLQTATDGDGTVNSGTSGDADETRFTSGTTTDIVTAIRKIGDDRHIPDTLLCTSEAWGHSIGVHQVPVGWDTSAPVQGFHAKMGILDVLFNNSALMHYSEDAEGGAFTNCVTLIFDRRNALVAGRKRWMSIENYSNPAEDIGGAVVTSRVDSSSVFNDSIYVLTES